MGRNRWNLPDLGFGIGLRTVHYSTILANHPPVDWFEILSENYMDTGGRPLYVLDQVAERYPVVLHGVSMSVGSTDPLNLDYLKKLKALADRTRAHWVSDHLCWTGVSGINVHDLLPMPYTDESLRYTIERVKAVSEILERPLVLENPSTYLEFGTSTWSEVDFLSTLGPGSRLRDSAGREQRLRELLQPRPGPGSLHRPGSRPTAWFNTTWPDTPTREPTFWTPTAITSSTKSGPSIDVPAREPAAWPPCWSGTRTFPASRWFTPKP